MALTVEDGNGLAGADSYLSVADATTYHTNMGNLTAWNAITDQEAALREATRYLDSVYGTKWPGERQTQAQGLDWPRFDAVDSDGFSIGATVIPQALKDACAELALRAGTAALLPDQSAEAGNTVVGKTEKVGPLSISTEYADRGSTRATYPWVDALLRKVIGGGGAGWVDLLPS